MLSGNPDLPQKSLQIKQDDKFFSRLLSKETSMANASSRVYYRGATGAVPFDWESQPGTPKHTFSTTHLPPLSPPPSFHSPSQNHPKKKRPSKSNFFYCVPRFNLKKNDLPSSFSSISSSSSSTANIPGGRRFSSSRSSSSSLSSWGDDEDPTRSPTSPLCFGVGQGGAGGLRSCYSMVIVKNALLSVVGGGVSGHGHGSAGGTA